MRFEKLHLSGELLRNLDQLGFTKTTDIQFKAIPSILKGEDVLAIAQTGTGKTAAFAIPLIQMIHSEKSSKRSLGIQCLVMVPTRELAQQIGEVFEKLVKHTKVKVLSVHGGVEHDPQIRSIQDGIDILIATPGRMFDLIHHGHIRLTAVRYLVLDEADRMLALGFREEVVAIKKKLRQRHQTLFFSATINQNIKKLAYSQVKSSAIRIQISPDNPVSRNVAHSLMFVEMDDKRHFLADLLGREPDTRVIVFVRTKVRAERVAAAMARVGIPSLTLHGDKTQQERKEILESFNKDKFSLLIATDLSSRGLDFSNVGLVINYDLPENPENYVHRIGRTGRGHSKGRAISFCAKEEISLLKDIEDFLGKAIPRIQVSPTGYSEIVTTSPLEADLQRLLEMDLD